MSLADRIMVMNRGRIEQEGTPEDIYAKPRTPFVAAFIGRANWFHGRLSRGTGACRLTTDAGTALTISDPGGADGAAWSACIRPERVTVTEAGGVGENRLAGGIVDVVNMGAALHYIIDVAEGRVMAIEPNRGGPRARRGDPVQISFRAEDCVVLPRSDQQTA